MHVAFNLVDVQLVRMMDAGCGSGGVGHAGHCSQRYARCTFVVTVPMLVTLPMLVESCSFNVSTQDCYVHTCTPVQVCQIAAENPDIMVLKVEFDSNKDIVKPLAIKVMLFR